MPAHTLPFLLSTLRMLADAQISIWVFGGWAEELWSVNAPRYHFACYNDGVLLV